MIYEERTIVITMNPEQLRKLADKMEIRAEKSMVGDSTFVAFLGVSPTLKVSLHFDQDWLHKKQIDDSL